MVTITVSDLTKTYGSSTPLSATVTDNGSPLVNVPVGFNIHGVDYVRNTDSNGVVRLNINLGIGAYDCKVSYGGVVRKVLVRVTDKPAINLIVSNFTKTYGDTTPLTAKISIPSIITGLPVRFTINGRSYDRLTDVNGEVKLNINLNPGVYPCTVTFPGNITYRETRKEITVTVKADTLIDGFNITKSYSDKGFYQCAVYDAWHRLNPCSVELTINGVKYTRSTNDEGLIRLNINLIPGEYPINVKFLGDATHNPSSRNDLVKVVPDILEMGSYTREGAYVPENNRGELKSHIFVYQFDLEKGIENKIVYHYGTGQVTTEHKDVAYTSYEITETDPRVKTAKFITDKYFDLTNGICYVKIISPYHENFGGIILKVDYDKNTGLYTYQCQDGRRQYLNKGITTSPGDVTIYDIIESELISPAYYKSAKYTLPLSQEQRTKHAPLLSGLHPIDDYKDLKSGTLKFDNKFKEKRQLLIADSSINTIMNLSHMDGFPTDVYFDSNLICRIDPVDLDYWLSHGIRLTHQDLVQYKYGFDTTNIITRVKAKNNNETYKNYDDAADLAFYFGGQAALIDAATTTTTTEGGTSSTGTNNVTTGIMSGKKTFDVGQDNGIVPDYRLDLIRALREKGHTVNDLGVGPSVVQNNGLKSSSKGHIGIYVCNGICCGTHQDFLNNMSSGAYHYDHAIFTWVRGDIEMNRKQAYAWDWYYGDIGLDKSITRQQFFDKHADKLSDVNLWPNGDNSAPLSRSDWGKQVQAIVNGQFNNGGGNAASTGSSQTTTTTVVDDTATYQKALDELSKSVRSLLSFEVKVPLNSPIFKNLHTNMMLWTQLPPEFQLGNLEKIFKILPAYKVNRGVAYLENRWYVEKVVIKQDTNGLFATITLNPFPSDYSSYSNAVKQYAEAYDQKFNQKNTTTTSSGGGGNGQPRLGNDSTDTNSMRAMGGGYYGNAGDNKNFDEAAKRGYAQQGRKYYDWARQYNTPLELAKALANRFQYVGYIGNHDANAEVTHNNGGTIRCNCYDACRLVKCCFDAAGFDAVIITGTIYEGGHGWNAVKHNGRWYSFDLCYAVGGRQWQGTNSLRLCDEW